MHEDRFDVLPGLGMGEDPGIRVLDTLELVQGFVGGLSRTHYSYSNEGDTMAERSTGGERESVGEKIVPGMTGRTQELSGTQVVGRAGEENGMGNGFKGCREV